MAQLPTWGLYPTTPLFQYNRLPYAYWQEQYLAPIRVEVKMTRPNVPVQNSAAVGAAIQKFVKDGAYKIMSFGDGSGHTEDNGGYRTSSWGNWNGLTSAVVAPVPTWVNERFRANYAKFPVGARVRYLGNNSVGTVTYFDLSDGMVKVMFDDSLGRDSWCGCSQLALESEVKPSIDPRFAAGFAKFPIGYKVTSTDGGYKGQNGIVTFHDLTDGMVKVKFDGFNGDSWKNVNSLKPYVPFEVKDNVIISDATSLHKDEYAWIVSLKGNDEAVIMPECGMLHTVKLSSLTKV